MPSLTLRGENLENVLMCAECDGPCENVVDDDEGGWDHGWWCPRCNYPPSMQDTYIVSLRQLRYVREKKENVDDD